MNITAKAEHDPVSDLLVVDGYVRWALLATEESLGKKGIAIVLRRAGLDHLIDNYPASESRVISNFTFADYTALNTALIAHFGRASRSWIERIGWGTAKHAIQAQGTLFSIAALIAAKTLPSTAQLKLNLETVQKGFRDLSQSIGQELHLHVEESEHTLKFVFEDCPFCAGKQASEPICWTMKGVLEYSLNWQTGRLFAIEEVSCRATGASACVWQINKSPKAVT